MAQETNSSRKMVSFAPDVYSSNPIKVSSIEPNRWEDGATAGFLPYKQIYGLQPRDVIDIDPEIWYLRSQKWKEVLEQNRPGDSTRMQKEVFPILFGPNADVWCRLGYYNYRDVVGLPGDPPEVSAARALVAFEGEALRLQMDLLNVVGLILTISRMKGIPLNKVVMAEKSISKLSTVLAMLKGIPMNKAMYDAYLKESQMMALRTEGATPDDAKMVLVIPFVPYGVCDCQDGRDIPEFEMDGNGRTILKPDTYDSSVQFWADKLDFYPTKMETIDSYTYGWITSARNMDFASGLEPNHNAAVHTDGQFRSPEFCSTANDVNRLIPMLYKHLNWLAVKLVRLWAEIPFADGSRKPLVDGTRRSIRFDNYDSQNDVDLRRLLLDPSYTMFDMAFDWDEFDNEKFAQWQHPVDFNKASKHYATVNDKISAVRQVHICPDGFTKQVQSMDTIISNYWEITKGNHQYMAFNDKLHMLTSFYMCTAVEINNTYQRLVAASGGRQNITEGRYDGQYDYNTIIPRPDIAITGIPRGSDGSDLDEIALVGMYPVAYEATSATDQGGAYAALGVTAGRKEFIPAANYIANGEIVDHIYAYKDANLNTRTNSELIHSASVTDLNRRRNPVAAINHKVHWASADPLQDATYNKPDDSRLLPERLPCGQFVMNKLLNAYNHTVLYTKGDKIKPEDYTLGKDVNKTFIDGELLTVFQQFTTVKASSVPSDIKIDVAGTPKNAVFKWLSVDDERKDLTSDQAAVFDTIRPWMIRQMYHDGAVNHDPIYAIDYQIVSSESIANNTVDKFKHDATFANDARLAKLQLRQTDFYDGVVDSINVDLSHDRWKKPGYIKDNFNIAEDPFYASKLMLRGIYFENVELLLTDRRWELNHKSSTHSDNSISKLEGFNAANNSSEVYGVGVVGTFRYDNILAIRPKIDGDYSHSKDLLQNEATFERWKSGAITIADINMRQNAERTLWKYTVLQKLDYPHLKDYGEFQWKYNINAEHSGPIGAEYRASFIDGSFKVDVSQVEFGSGDSDGFYQDFIQIGRPKRLAKFNNSRNSQSSNSKGGKKDESKSGRGSKGNKKRHKRNGGQAGGPVSEGAGKDKGINPENGSAFKGKNNSANKDAGKIKEDAKNTGSNIGDTDPTSAGIQKVSE